MPYPAALGRRPLEAQEAYEALQQYAADYGREPLLLLMHAALPETLRADLLALIRLNFRPRGRADASLDADVLFAPFTTALGGGYHRIDAQVRRHALALLRSYYRDDRRPRAVRVAELLWRYVEATERRVRRGADPMLAGFLDVQRWVALSFLEPAAAAQAFADALRQAGQAAPVGGVALRLGGLGAALELPLGHRPELIAYARGLDALADGDDTRAQALLGVLGDAPLRVGEVELEAPAALLARRAAVTGPSGAPVASESRRTVLLVLADYPRSLRVERQYTQRRDGLRDLWSGLCSELGFELIVHDAPRDLDLFEHMLSVDVVVCEVAQESPQSAWRAGVALALRSDGAVLMGARRDDVRRAELSVGLTATFDDRELAHGLQGAFAEGLRELLAGPATGGPGNPLRQLLPGLQSPRLEPARRSATEIDPARRPTCVFLSVHRLGAIAEAVAETARRAGLRTVAPDDPFDSPAQRYQMLAEATVVVVDLDDAPTETLLAAGLCSAWRPDGLVFLTSGNFEPGIFAEQLGRVVLYRWSSKSRSPELDSAFATNLEKHLHAAAAGQSTVSPVYRALPGLRPARLVLPRRRVFLAYGLDYLPFARRLADALAPQVQVDWDQTLASGDLFEARRASMLAGADAVVAVAGRLSARRLTPVNEARRAIALGKRLIPVFVDPFNAPAGMRDRMCANVDADGRILYLAELEGPALERAIALTVDNILAALDAPPPSGDEAQRSPPTLHASAAFLSAEPPSLDEAAWRFLAAGGSWFAAPSSGLLAQTVWRRPAAAVVCARPTGYLRRMVEVASDPGFAQLLAGRNARRWDAVLLSVGGDDLLEAVGTPARTTDGQAIGPDRRLLLESSEWGPADAGVSRFVSDAGWARLEGYLQANLDTIVARRDAGPSKGVTLFLHAFPAPEPGPEAPERFGGPWLLPAFDRAGVPRRECVALAVELVDRLNRVLRATAADTTRYPNTYCLDVPGGLLPPAGTGAVQASRWLADKHVAPGGYARLAQAWSAQIESTLAAV